MTKQEIDERCVQVADTVVPQYRNAKRSYSCTGGMAKRWAAAFDGARIALGHDPAHGQALSSHAPGHDPAKKS